MTKNGTSWQHKLDDLLEVHSEIDLARLLDVGYTTVLHWKQGGVHSPRERNLKRLREAHDDLGGLSDEEKRIDMLLGVVTGLRQIKQLETAEQKDQAATVLLDRIKEKYL